MARYRIIPEESAVWIEARSSLHPLSIKAHGLEGWIDLTIDGDGVVDTEDAPAGRLCLAVDRLTCGSRIEDAELRRRIDARHHPTIDGVLGGVEPTDTPHRYEVSGDLTFNGVTRSYKEEMWIEPLEKETIRLDGWARFDLRDFGVRPPRLLFVRVEPHVEVRVELLAEEIDRRVELVEHVIEQRAQR